MTAVDASAGRLWRLVLPVICLIMLPASRIESQDASGTSFVDTFLPWNNKRWLVSHGWSNGSYQNCTFQSANAKLARGTGGAGGLTLTLNKAEGLERPYACAEVQSRARYGFGVFEVRMSSAVAPGIVSAFFTYTGPGHDPKAPHDEIDFEFLGRDPRRVQLNYFAAGKGEHAFNAELSYDASAEMHDYAFEWLPDRISWYIDGRLVHRVERKAGQPFPSTPGKIVMSIWTGAGPNMEAWLKAFAYPGQPLVARIARVAFTRMGDACQFPGSIACAPRP